MSYYDTYSHFRSIQLDKVFSEISSGDVEKAIYSEYPDNKDLLALLSPAAENYLEMMARHSRNLTLQYFGKAIQLYTPIYLANYCENSCLYCAFRSENSINRVVLNAKQVESEARHIADMGFRHILVLTGDSRAKSPVSYIKDCATILRKYFSSISVEIYPLTENEYREIIDCGVDGLTIYQETYNKTVYSHMHPSGPKQDYRFRLDAPERAARAGIRNINIGALLGLDDWRGEVFSLGLHGKYLQDKFPGTEIGIAVPRLRPHIGNFQALHEVSDKNILQIILALRIFSPRFGISLSTRERDDFRDNLIGLGITRMSAGSSTKVGGHTLCSDNSGEVPQFDISDTRSPADINKMLSGKGYQGVFKDWTPI